jgi:hypothetical protein
MPDRVINVMTVKKETKKVVLGTIGLTLSFPRTFGISKQLVVNKHGVYSLSKSPGHKKHKRSKHKELQRCYEAMKPVPNTFTGPLKVRCGGGE